MSVGLVDVISVTEVVLITSVVDVGMSVGLVDVNSVEDVVFSKSVVLLGFGVWIVLFGDIISSDSSTISTEEQRMQ